MVWRWLVVGDFGGSKDCNRCASIAASHNLLLISWKRDISMPSTDESITFFFILFPLMKECVICNWCAYEFIYSVKWSNANTKNLHSYIVEREIECFVWMNGLHLWMLLLSNTCMNVHHQYCSSSSPPTQYNIYQTVVIKFNSFVASNLHSFAGNQVQLLFTKVILKL
jgi:hypothetical protein